MAIRLRRGLDSDRLTVLLEQGEIAYTTDTKKLYIGDGVTLGGNGVSSSATSLITEGRNSTGSTLYKGTIIRIQGSTGALPNFVKAQGNNDANSAQTFGVIMNDIANNANGFVVTNGAIDTLDTRSTATHPFTDVTLADGDLLYLHPTIAGYVTNVKPYAPQHLVYVGVITRTSPTAGTIVYRIQNGYELDELHDVAAQTPSNNDGLFYESSTSLWKNKSISTVLGYTPIPLTGLSASSPLAYNNTTGAFSIQVANGSQNGYLSSTDWTTFNGKQATISLTTTGSSGASTFAANVLNIPTYTLSGLGGQPLNTNLTSISALTFASTSFVKMTASGTFALDTNTYLTAESDTLASVTGRGNSTTNAITVGGLTVATNLIYTDTVNGRVGIGTSSPDRPLHINSVGTTGLRIDVTGGGSNAIFLGAASSLIRWSNGAYFSNTGMYSQVNDQQYITFDGTNTQVRLQIKASNGNIGINTTTDSGFKLDVNGTARIQNQLTTTGSITAASAIARGVYMNQTLVAAANNDVLVGLDIQPTFTNGAFTGVLNLGLRVKGSVDITNTNPSDVFAVTNQVGKYYLNAYTWYAPSSYIIQANGYLLLSSNGNPIRFSTDNGTNNQMRIHTTGNVVIQNGGTFTDAGYRLDVVGTARIQGVTTITPDAVTGTLSTSSLDISQTWNTTGTPIAIKLNVTDTASGSLSDLISLRVGGVDKFRVVKSGYFVHSSSGEINGVLVVGSNSYNAASQLEVTSTSRGFLPPRMTTTQKNAIATPPGGLIVYDNTLNSLGVYNGTLWGPLITGVGTITASSALAQGVYFNNTLVAAANNDVLVGLDINPTFTNGSFTGVAQENLVIRGGNNPLIRFKNSTGTTIWGQFGANSTELTFNAQSGNLNFVAGNTQAFYIFTATRNAVFQNGGTFTDAGYRLDVVGADSRFNGIRAGLGAGQVATNTVFGNGALNANTTGSANVAIGFETLKAVTTGTNNTALGYFALRANITGGYNVAIGTNALAIGTSIIDTVAIGGYAGNNITTGNFNTAIGSNALRLNTTASNNTAIGSDALRLTTGFSNTGIGTSCLSANTTGYNNTAIGFNNQSGNFSECIILGVAATATANNQFVVGSSVVNAGAVATAVGPVINEYWTVIINGVSKKIALIA